MGISIWRVLTIGGHFEDAVTDPRVTPQVVEEYPVIVAHIFIAMYVGIATEYYHIVTCQQYMKAAALLTLISPIHKPRA